MENNMFDFLKKVSTGEKSIVINDSKIMDKKSSEQLNKAIDKLDIEMKTSTNPYVKYVGEYLIKRIKDNPEISHFYLNGNKSIEKGLISMQDIAKNKVKERKGSQMVMLSDQEGFEIIQNYFEKEKSKDNGKNKNNVTESDPDNEGSDDETDIEE